MIAPQLPLFDTGYAPRCQVGLSSLIGGEEETTWATCPSVAAYRIRFDGEYHASYDTFACVRHAAMARENPRVHILAMSSLSDSSSRVATER
jgi:hypothetical protein